MTTDLRAALRAAASAWESLGTRAAHPECDSHPLVNPDHCAAHAADLRALADAPPTVAELQVDPRVIAGSHAFVMRSGPPGDPPGLVAIRWGKGEVDGFDGPHDVEAWWFLPCEDAVASVGLGDGWEIVVGPFFPSELNQPASIVEVTP